LDENVFESIDNSSLSGFGKTRISIPELLKYNKFNVGFMNSLFEIVNEYFNRIK
jgi:hypothetical protein